MALVVVEVEAVAFAVAPHFAVGTLPLACPAAVAVGLEAVFPHVPQVVAVDVALVHVAADAGAAGDGSVAEYGGHFDAGSAIVVLVAHAAFVVTQVAFAGVACFDESFFAHSFDEVEHSGELPVVEAQFGVVGCSAHGEDGEEAPPFYSEGEDVAVELVELVVVARIDAGDDVPQQVGCLAEEADGLAGTFETVRGLPHPVVFVFKSVEADGDGVHAAAEEAVEALRGEEVAVGDHAPGESASIEFEAAGVDVLPQEGFAAGEDDEDLVWVDVGCDVVDGFEEVGCGHVGRFGADFAVATAVSAVHVATQCALPKEGAQGVQLGIVVAVLAPDFLLEVQGYFLLTVMSSSLVRVPRFQPCPSTVWSSWVNLTSNIWSS